MAKASLQDRTNERLESLNLIVPHKPIWWVGSALDELKALPAKVQYEMGVALRAAQGSRVLPGVRRHSEGKTTGWEVAKASMDFETDTYRTFFTLWAFDDVIFVLCAFKKKSTEGKATPKVKIALVATRFAMAKKVYADPPKELQAAITKYHAAHAAAASSTPRSRGRKT